MSPRWQVEGRISTPRTSPFFKSITATNGGLAVTSPDADRVLIISSDCHAGADLLDYKPYLESRWHDEFDAWATAFHDPWIEVDPGVAGMKFGGASSATSTSWDSAQRLAD